MKYIHSIGTDTMDTRLRQRRKLRRRRRRRQSLPRRRVITTEGLLGVSEAASAASTAEYGAQKEENGKLERPQLPPQQQDASWPFEVDPTDHAETPAIAYADVAPLLGRYARLVGTKERNLRIYDPYYCDGAVQRHLHALGFHEVINHKEDFYVQQSTHQVPSHDVLVTNPPYSGDHLRRIFEFAISTPNRPWLLLLPWFVVRKDWYRRAFASGGAQENRAVVYLVPRRRYFFQPPGGLSDKMTGSARKTAPFETFWYCSFGTPAMHAKVVAGWQAHEQGRELRLASGFKKRRGQPGWHTALDAKGLLFDKPVPPGWNH